MRGPLASEPTRPGYRGQALILAAALGSWMAVLVARGWFYSDDLYNLTEARSMGFGWHYLTRDLFGHVVPGFMALAWLVARPGDARFGWAAAETGLGFTVALVLAGMAARALGASRRAALAAMALSGASTLWVGATVWWSAALNAVPGAVGGLALLLAHLWWMARRTWWALATAALALVAALSVQEGSAVFVVLAVLVTLAWHTDGPPGARLRALARLWPAWLVYGAACLGSATLTQTVGHGLGAGHPGPAPLLEFPFVAGAKAFLPAQLGLAVGAFQAGGSETITVVVALVVGALGLAWWSAATGSAGRWAVAIVVLVVAARAVLVAWARFSRLDWSAATDQRYLADLAWLGPVLAAAAWTRDGAVVAGSDGARRARRFAPAVVLAGVALGLGGQVAQARSVGPYAARRYRDRFRASYQVATSATPNASVLDVAAGEQLAPALLARFTLLSRTMGLDVRGMRFDSPTAPLLAPDPSGRLRPVRLTPVAVLAVDRGSPAPPAPAGGAPGDGTTCWAYRAARVVWFPLSPRVGLGAWVLRLDLGSQPTGWSAADPPTLWVADRARTPRRLQLVFHPGSHGRLLLSPLPFQADRLGIEIRAGQTLCLRAGSVDAITPR